MKLEKEQDLLRWSMENKEPLTISFAELVILAEKYSSDYWQFETVINAFMERVYRHLQGQKNEQ